MVTRGRARRGARARVAAVFLATGFLAALFLTAGCGSGSGAATIHPDPSLVAVAQLADCPSSGPAVKGGLPDVTLPCLNGHGTVRLAGLRGPALVNLWYSSCEPCRREAPLLGALASDPRVLVLGIDAENPTDGLRFVARQGLRYAQLSDADHRAQDAGLFRGFPVSYVLDPTGRVVATHPGEITSAAELNALVAKGFPAGAGPTSAGPTSADPTSGGPR